MMVCIQTDVLLKCSGKTMSQILSLVMLKVLQLRGVNYSGVRLIYVHTDY